MIINKNMKANNYTLETHKPKSSVREGIIPKKDNLNTIANYSTSKSTQRQGGRKTLN